jgi:hypothetical protein
MPFPQLTEPLGEGYGAAVPLADCPQVDEYCGGLVVVAGTLGGNQLVDLPPGSLLPWCQLVQAPLIRGGRLLCPPGLVSRAPLRRRAQPCIAQRLRRLLQFPGCPGPGFRQAAQAIPLLPERRRRTACTRAPWPCATCSSSDDLSGSGRRSTHAGRSCRESLSAISPLTAAAAASKSSSMRRKCGVPRGLSVCGLRPEAAHGLGPADACRSVHPWPVVATRGEG